jgi:hypothetical protein
MKSFNATFEQIMAKKRKARAEAKQTAQYINRLRGLIRADDADVQTRLRHKDIRGGVGARSTIGLRVRKTGG